VNLQISAGFRGTVCETRSQWKMMKNIVLLSRLALMLMTVGVDLVFKGYSFVDEETLMKNI
jgi:hypothetical protein